MAKLEEHNDHIDPRLKKMLAELNPVPERSAQAVNSGRSRFMAELEMLMHWQAANSPKRSINSNPNKLKEIFQMLSRPQKFAFASLATLILVIAVLFGSTSITVAAARSALPGDALYGVKTGWEQTQARLADGSYERSMLYLDFARVRLDEIASLINEGRYQDIPVAVEQFKRYVELALGSMQELAQTDPIRAAQLATDISDSLARYAGILSSFALQVPDSLKGELESALNSSLPGDQQPGEQEFYGVVEAIFDTSWTVSGQIVSITTQTEIKGAISVGDQVKVHAYLAPDGSLTAREIELAIGDINGNANDNDNSNTNGNDNDDDSANDNDNDGNLNSNSNEDHSNSNANDDDDKSNQNGGNDNRNDNDSDDNNNDNDSDDNSNDDDSDGNDNDDDDDNDNDDDGDSNPIAAWFWRRF